MTGACRSCLMGRDFCLRVVGHPYSEMRVLEQSTEGLVEGPLSSAVTIYLRNHDLVGAGLFQLPVLTLKSTNLEWRLAVRHVWALGRSWSFSQSCTGPGTEAAESRECGNKSKSSITRYSNKCYSYLAIPTGIWTASFRLCT